MTRAPVTIHPWASCHEAIVRMQRARVRHLPVVDAQDRLVGMITDRDLRHHLFSSEVYLELRASSVAALLRRVPVSAIMSAPAVAVRPEDDLREATIRMMDRKLGSLPVVEGERLVGILTETDLLRHICRADAPHGELAGVLLP